MSTYPWGNSLLLDDNESVVKHWSGRVNVDEKRQLTRSVWTTTQYLDGYLVLTTRKLVFIEARGVFGKSYHSLLTYSLEEIRGLSMGGFMEKYVSVSDSHGENMIYVKGVGSQKEFETFSRAVQSQQATRKQEIYAQKKKDRVQITMDFSFLREYMDKGGLSLQAVKCPQCGAPISLPKEGNEVKCEHCGSTIFAQDVMEKVKQLIG